VQHLVQDISDTQQLIIDFVLLLLQEIALIRDLRVYRLEVVQDGQVFEVGDRLVERFGRFGNVRSSDLKLEQVYLSLAGLVQAELVQILK
jgi:hypothetical protein